VILLFLFNLGVCFEIENLFGAQFGELENVYKIVQEILAKNFSFDRVAHF